MALADGFPGRDIILNWNGAEIAGSREKKISINSEALDTTDDDSLGWRQLLETSGQQQIDLGISGLTKSQVLKNDFFGISGATKIRPVTITYLDGGILSGNFRLNSYAETGKYNDLVAFEATIQSTGVVTFTPGP